MDPLSALSVAAAAAQFVDFSAKLVPKIIAVYRDIDSAEKSKLSNLKLVATRLQDLSSEIDKTLGLVKHQRPLSSSEEAVSLTAQECSFLSDELLSAMKKAAPQWFSDEFIDSETATADTKGLSIWQRSRQSIRTVWSIDAIEGLQKKLDNLRQQLMMEMVTALYQRFSPSLNQNIDSNSMAKTKTLICSTSPTNLTAPKRWNAKLAETINANTQVMLQSQQYRTTQIRLADWESTHVGSRLTDMLLEHLSFPELLERERRIVQPYTKTFEWIFNGSRCDSSKEEVNGPSFHKWLRDGSDLYWITGKAGSGKSTLLKYIHNHPQTKEGIQGWSRDKPLITAVFFFWDAGSEVQKSQGGMIRSLIYQCLQQRRQLQPKLSSGPSRWDAFALSKDFDRPWEWSEIADAWGILMEDCSRGDVCYFFLIDGLDEFNGSKLDLIALLKPLSSLTNVKMCISSRPWVVFEDAYKQKPSLTVQELTRTDIGIYVASNFERHAAFLELLEADPKACRNIINEVTTKASGVFLWVVLVVKSLLTGMMDGDRPEDLQQRLDEIPEELEGLFGKMLHSMDPTYYTQASEIFQIFRAAKRRPSLLCMSFAHEKNEQLAFLRETQQIDDKERKYRGLNMKRRLNSTCKGLLEVESIIELNIKDGDTTEDKDYFHNLLDLVPCEADSLRLSNARIDYLHRTVKDWLHRPDIWAQILSATPKSFDPIACLARAHLLQLKVLPLDMMNIPEYGFWDLITWCTEYCIQLDESNLDLQVKLFDCLNEAAIHLSTSNSNGGKTFVQRFWGRSQDEDIHWASTVSGGQIYHGFLDFAVRCQLHHLLKKKLALEGLNKVQLSSLLYTSISAYIFAPALGDAPSCNHSRPSTKIIKLLLHEGADPNTIVHEDTPWERLDTMGCNDADMQALFRRYGGTKFEKARKERTSRRTLQDPSQASQLITGPRNMEMANTLGLRELDILANESSVPEVANAVQAETGKPWHKNFLFAARKAVQKPVREYRLPDTSIQPRGQSTPLREETNKEEPPRRREVIPPSPSFLGFKAPMDNRAETLYNFRMHDDDIDDETGNASQFTED